MRLCTRESVCDRVLAVYVEKAEEFNPGVVDRTIEDVSGEIIDVLSYRYPQPWPNVPQLLANIASVFAAYRIMGAITSIVDTEAASDNEWIPLQQQFKSCEKQLDDLAKGKLKLPFEEVLRDREEASVAVINGKKRISMAGF